MTWQQFKDLDPNYSGYAWVHLTSRFDNHQHIFMARIWTYDKKVSDHWCGWNLDSDSELGLNRFFNDYEVMLLEKPK